MRLFRSTIAESGAPRLRRFGVPASAGGAHDLPTRIGLCSVPPAEAGTPNLKAQAERAFTLLEVIIACALFFIFAFAVIELVTRGLNAARAIQVHEPDAALILGPYSTNRVFEAGTDSGDFEDLYPGVYPGYTWTRDTIQPFGETNPLYQVTVVVTGNIGRRKHSESVMSVLMYGADSPIRPGAGTFSAPPR